MNNLYENENPEVFSRGVVHRSKDPLPIIVGPEFSSFELEMCKKFKIIPLLYNGKNDMKLIKWKDI